MARNVSAPASAATLTKGRAESFWRRLTPPINTRTPRRQHLAAHLHRCGVRPMFEAMLELEAGQPLDEVLERYCRLVPELYASIGADQFPPDQLFAIEGGRR